MQVLEIPQDVSRIVSYCARTMHPSVDLSSTQASFCTNSMSRLAVGSKRINFHQHTTRWYMHND